MSFDQISYLRDGRCDIKVIRQFWDAALKRLKAHAELVASGPRPSAIAKDSTRRIDGDEKQP
jgi:hypothetical protein